jgi:hypothetical protein
MRARIQHAVPGGFEIELLGGIPALAVRIPEIGVPRRKRELLRFPFVENREVELVRYVEVEVVVHPELDAERAGAQIDLGLEHRLAVAVVDPLEGNSVANAMLPLAE